MHRFAHGVARPELNFQSAICSVQVLHLFDNVCVDIPDYKTQFLDQILIAISGHP